MSQITAEVIEILVPFYWDYINKDNVVWSKNENDFLEIMKSHGFRYAGAEPLPTGIYKWNRSVESEGLGFRGYSKIDSQDDFEIDQANFTIFVNHGLMKKVS